MRRALICGVQGQDGSYLAELLLDKGYTVVGTSRDALARSSASGLPETVRERIEMVTMAPTDFRSVLQVVERARPDEVYALAGQTSVGLSFETPIETLDSIIFGTLNLLEALRSVVPAARFYHASSSECFGDLAGRPATEETAFHPRSPYGVAKASAHMLVRNYRDAYGLFTANGMLFNHESPRRPPRFVTRKIVSAAKRIAAGSDDKLHLGRIEIVRDWGWAPEYVDAMWRILQQPEPEDFIIATGASSSLEAFVETAFDCFGLDWRDYVVSDPALARPSDLDWSGADPSHAELRLGWRAATLMPEVARRMAAAEPG